jgi:predicted acylesterase/phospholipase RssA/CRP-like cAMP-binding protein
VSSPTLDGLRAALIESGSSTPVYLDPGEALMHQDQSGDLVYLLVEGSLEVSREVDGETAILAIIDEPGSLVGEMVAMGGGSRTATVIARERSELVSTQAKTFQHLLETYPEIAASLISVAIRRAEEGELADLLAGHFGIVDEATLISACGGVTWRTLTQGETLLAEGDESDSLYFVVRGRLVATKFDPVKGEDVKVGELGRGDAIGEIGLLARTPRAATVTAVRDSVLARMGEPTFLSLIEREPRMAIELCLRAIAKNTETTIHSGATVLGVASIGLNGHAALIDSVHSELSQFGPVGRLSREIVDRSLETPGIADSKRAEIGDIRVSRMIHEVELGSQYVIVELGDEPGAWSQRAMGLIDRLLIVVPSGATSDQIERIEWLVGDCPAHVKRTVVITHESKIGSPSGTAEVRARLGAEEATHISPQTRGDVARLARVSVGRANTLVLGGGGGRGFTHIGVYQALTELGFPIDMVGGTSIGGVIGAVVADELTPDEIIDWAGEHFPGVLDYTLPVVSLTKGNRIARSARGTFGDRDIEDLWRTYFALSTDLTTSRVHVHENGSIVTAIRATSAIPGVMPPVPFGDALLIDGGVLNNLPIDVARQKSPKGQILAVDVAPPRGPGAHGDYGLSVSGWSALRSNLGGGRSPYPRLSAVLMRSMITASMRERDSQVQAHLADCYLDLDIRGVSMLDFKDPSGVARRGYEAAMPKLEAWLGSRPPTDSD